MTAREAKRLACHHVALLIDSTIGRGWNIGSSDIDGDVKTEADRFRLEVALLEIEDEMRNRGTGTKRHEKVPRFTY